jgi:hypothetical protein
MDELELLLSETLHSRGGAPGADTLLTQVHAREARDRRQRRTGGAVATVVVVGAAFAWSNGLGALTGSQGSQSGSGTANLAPCAVVNDFPPNSGANVKVTAAMIATADAMGRVLCTRLGGGARVEQLEEWVSMGGLAGDSLGLTYNIQTNSPSKGAGSPMDQGDVWLAISQPHPTTSTGPVKVSVSGEVLNAQWPDGTLIQMDSGHDTATNRAIIADPVFDAFSKRGVAPSTAAATSGAPLG